MFTNTLSDEEMVKIKVVDIDELYNFILAGEPSRRGEWRRSGGGGG